MKEWELKSIDGVGLLLSKLAGEVLVARNYHENVTRERDALHEELKKLRKQIKAMKRIQPR